ncbi:NAD(P)/FAD-dependent oxidoreductase [Pseudomonas nicosulfuronedens]|uniref:NAD(P)/FAD-dependent oxidoreductase n=1 Tax=Pseudomonas nicosulfuronedens TaxID=2571105 RepID=A0A5R9QRI2_9PSED|nr:NAD(P)/FAD-dependent oxidoreductase [Pseudomonas nicosulfuronedens]MDH1012777.1 NAD(P)/FAD-dependent oxidoreductase [Pseudomonas nicosulfuronedens]MDH1979991.1 NAD(P)/FAD-dependent oxidoreductase [Pseudomonas nicosulfuronedens]MDH2030321.1 NAD(P)/FAD-dependent oxidoreductase [Pseudomonas nicosulfuronedens]TLX72488.1 NAD(P)/FAD-dependent oxidoreductase [Pseudomonas nicosulfuronedens]
MTKTKNHGPASVDVLIIGAGISGIGAAYHLQKDCPTLSYTIIEARADLGGTWDLFRYPGIRSDSDLFTFGYGFKPWKENKAIADGASIKAYIAETARENGIDRNIRFQHRVIDTDWSSERQRWQVTVRREDSHETQVIEARWIFTAAGYYRYDQGFAPDFQDQEQFQGPIVHPQHWPENLDYRGKRVVVIGSGATAVTLIPSMAAEAAHITMLQRTPTYVLPVPAQDPIARRLRPWLGVDLAFALTRRFNIAKQRWVYAFCQRFPNKAREIIRKLNTRMLPEGYPVDVHFNPPYNPWEQRMCAVPGGDLFKVISSGKASIVTDHIERFTPTGIQLRSGEHLEADLIVTATGLNLQPLGGIQPKIDGQVVPLAQCVTYKGMLLSGIPNFAIAIGYTSSSWTLKIGLLCEHFTRLLGYMEKRGHEVCTPRADPSMKTEPLLNFGAGYVQRSLDKLPRQGTKHPWSMSWSYAADVKVFRKGRIDDPALEFVSAKVGGAHA